MSSASRYAFGLTILLSLGTLFATAQPSHAVYASPTAAPTAGATPLMQAAGEGDTAKVTSLLNTGADINAKDGHGNTALLWAEMSGDPDTIKWRDAHPDPAHTLIPYNPAIIWPLPLERGYPDVVRLLIERGANVNVQDSAYGRTPLMWAANNIYGNLVSLLLDKGADQAAKDKQGQTALSLTPETAANIYIGGPNILSLLVDWDTLDKQPNLNTPDPSGKTPLMYAALTDNVEQVHTLLREGPDVNAAGGNGETPLITASEGHDAIVQILLDQGAKVNIADRVGWTPLTSAARWGTVKTMRLLVSRRR